MNLTGPANWSDEIFDRPCRACWVLHNTEVAGAGDFHFLTAAQHLQHGDLVSLRAERVTGTPKYEHRDIKCTECCE